jgi:translation initiation factor IF-1
VHLRRSHRVALLFTLAVLPLAACGGGGGDGFGCQGRSCTASFQGPGEQDLSSKLGEGATVSVETVDGKSVTARIAGKNVKLVKGEMQRVEGYDVTLTDVDGEDVSIRIVGD